MKTPKKCHATSLQWPEYDYNGWETSEMLQIRCQIQLAIILREQVWMYLITHKYMTCQECKAMGLKPKIKGIVTNEQKRDEKNSDFKYTA